MSNSIIDDEDGDATRLFYPIDNNVNGMPVLVCIAGYSVGYIKEVSTSNEFIIGRDPQCSFTINSTSVSRNHAKITKIENEYFITDLDSTNGTYVDNTKIVKLTKLINGTLIRIGSITFKFLESNSTEISYHNQLFKFANYDVLTGAYNRRYFEDNAGRTLKLIERQKESISLFLCDIDDFKKINDTYGHTCGDQVLISTVGILKKALRAEDIFSRIGGEEFVILLPNTRSTAAAILAKRLVTLVSENEITYQSTKLYCTISIGFTCIDYLKKKFDNKDIENMLIEADKALYIAKNNGKNRFVQYI